MKTTSHLFTLPLHLVYWLTLKIANDLLFLHLSMHYNAFNCCFSHLIGLRRANARNVRLYYPNISSTPTFSYFDLYLHSAYAAHYGTQSYGIHVNYFRCIYIQYSELEITNSQQGPRGVPDFWLWYPPPPPFQNLVSIRKVLITIHFKMLYYVVKHYATVCYNLRRYVVRHCATL